MQPHHFDNVPCRFGQEKKFNNWLRKAWDIFSDIRYTFSLPLCHQILIITTIIVLICLWIVAVSLCLGFCFYIWAFTLIASSFLGKNHFAFFADGIWHQSSASGDLQWTAERSVRHKPLSKETWNQVHWAFRSQCSWCNPGTLPERFL